MVLNTTKANIFTKGNFQEEKEMEKEFSSIQMEVSMKGSFLMAKEMVKECIMMQ